MALRFDKLRWRNVLSTGNAFIEIDLHHSPNTLIIGDNGSGKSTLCDALCFALFGRPYRNVNKPQLVNSINGKNLLAEVEFTIGRRHFMIRRGLKPAVFEIFIDGQLVDQSAKVRDYQEYLEKNILKLNYKSFTQIVILGSSNFIPFMQLKAAARREIIESLLDIRVFSIMNMLLKQRVADNKIDLQDINYQLNLIEEKIDLHAKYVETQKKDNEAALTRNSEAIAEAEKTLTTKQELIDQINLSIEKLRLSITDSAGVEKDTKEFAFAWAKLDSQLKKLDDSVEFYTCSNTCPTCAQGIEEDFRQQTILDHMTHHGQLIEMRDQIRKQIEKVGLRNNQIAKINQQIFELNSAISSSNIDISALNNYIRKVQVDNAALLQVHENTSVDKTERAKLKADRRKFEKNKERLINNRTLLIIANELLKDRGIKTIIIKQYVPIMNKFINNYLTAMEFFVDFELDENFNETIRSRYRDEFSYESFSEGEKQRIDLALLFTWRSIAKLKNSMSTNLLILDETFDSSLDTAGCEDFLKLIYDLGKDTNVFVISHKGDILQDKFRSLIRFEKHKGFTRIIGENGES